MALKPEDAADIAKRHGLTLTDAAGLLGLADDAAEADAIAARFADGPSGDSVGADYVRQLFGRDAAETSTDDGTDDEPQNGHGSTEGANPKTVPTDEIEMRRFVAELFNQPTDN